MIRFRNPATHNAAAGIPQHNPWCRPPVYFASNTSTLREAFGGVNAVPLCVRSKDVDEIVNTVALLAGSFGGVCRYPF